MKLTIDASSIVSGGGLTHLIELINNIKSDSVSIKVIGSEKVLNKLPDYIIKVGHPYLNGSIFKRFYFQLIIIDKLLTNTDILFSITGDYLGAFRPLVGMSQNMLLYEKENLKGFGLEKIKFFINFFRQKISFKKSDGIIFLSNHALKIVGSKIDLSIKHTKIINHGVNHKFFKNNISSENLKRKVLYVSSFHYYKNQLNVIKAFNLLKLKYHNINLTLVGNFINKSYKFKILNLIQKSNSSNWIKIYDNVNYNEINKFYDDSDLIVFASSCENMPLILIESMASAKPIICSNKPPMTEFLPKINFYFDPKDVNSIYNSILSALETNENELMKISTANLVQSKKYNWSSTAFETVEFIEMVFNTYKTINNGTK